MKTIEIDGERFELNTAQDLIMALTKLLNHPALKPLEPTPPGESYLDFGPGLLPPQKPKWEVEFVSDGSGIQNRRIIEIVLQPSNDPKSEAIKEAIEALYTREILKQLGEEL